jgi:ABC-type phosphate/phosphonate transport system permease subunit
LSYQHIPYDLAYSVLPSVKPPLISWHSKSFEE